MKFAIITEAGEMPLQTKELADEVVQRLPTLTRLALAQVLRKAIAEVEADLKKQTTYLPPQHK